MDPKIKLLVVLLPFVIAGYVGFSMLQPAIDEANAKQTTVGEKTTEKEDLENKLRSVNTISSKQIELTSAIEKLRGSVPKSPDIDLLTIDLEKMCREAGMNMVAIQTPKDQIGVSRPRNDNEHSQSVQNKQDKLKNALKGNLGGGADAGAAAAAEPPRAELDQTAKQFIVTGDFNGLQKLCHELETYQRVVRIDDITFRVPRKESAKDKVKIDDAPPSDGEELGDPNMLFITMTLTTFFLP